MTTALTETDSTRGRRRWFRVRKLDDLKMPDVKIPDGLRLPDAQKIVENIDLDRLNIKLPGRVDLPGGLELRRRSGFRLPAAVIAAVGGLLGAVAVLLLDPQVGRSRRAYVRDRITSKARHLGRRSGHVARWLASDASGLGQRIRSVGEPAEQLDEVDLAHKVETELFRDSKVEKGRLSINAERDVVFLRGTASTLEEITGIEERVREIEGVRHVVNLLHLPGTTAPADSYHAEAATSRG